MLMRPTSAFVSEILGYPVVLGPTDILEDTDPHVRAYPTCFVEVTANRAGTVEQATAAPGERRNIKK